MSARYVIIVAFLQNMLFYCQSVYSRQFIRHCRPHIEPDLGKFNEKIYTNCSYLT